MSLIRRSIGLIPLGLGSIGVLVCIALILVTWFTSERALALSERLFSQADRVYKILDRQIEKAQVGLTHTNDLLSVAEYGLEKDIDEERIKEFIQKPEFKAMEARIKGAVEQLEAFIELLSGCEDLLQESQQALQVDANASPPKKGEFGEAVANCRIELLRMCRVVSDAEACYRSLEQGSDMTNNIQTLQRMQPIIRGHLTQVQQSVDKLRFRFEEQRLEVKATEQKLRQWARGLEYGIMIVLSWIGVGQLALAYCGIWRIGFVAAAGSTEK